TGPDGPLRSVAAGRRGDLPSVAAAGRWCRAHEPAGGSAVVQRAGGLRDLLPGVPVRRLVGDGCQERHGSGDVRNRGRSMMATQSTGAIVLVGAGNMGGAMLAGWLDSGIPGSLITVLDPSPSAEMVQRIADAGARHSTVPPEGLVPEVVFLAVKPQVMETVLPPMKAIVSAETVVVSVAAGKTLAFLETHLGEAAMVRAMPNTPAMIG